MVLGPYPVIFLPTRQEVQCAGPRMKYWSVSEIPVSEGHQVLLSEYILVLLGSSGTNSGRPHGVVKTKFGCMLILILAFQPEKST